MTLTPLFDQVLLRPDSPEERSAGGIYLPERRNIESRIDASRARFGTVVAIGPGRKNKETGELLPMPVGLTPGLRVVFAPGTGSELAVNGEAHVMVEAKDVLGILKGERK
jgi:chaperonin GroES